MESMNLPMEPIIQILSRLPVKSLLRFKCVSKTWLNLISSKEFIKLHYNQFPKSNSNGTIILLSRKSLHSFDFHNPERGATELYHPSRKPIETDDFEDEYQLVGSYNGLICLEGICYLALYNPATREFRQVPRHKRYVKIPEHCYFRAINKFAYDCIADDYKILSFITFFLGSDKIGDGTQLYGMKSNSWEMIQSPPNWNLDCFHLQSVVCHNTLYWIYNYDIRSFDLSTKKFDEIKLPEKDIVTSYYLAVFQGQLHLVTSGFDIWRLNKDDDGDEKVWCQTFRFSPVSPPKDDLSTEKSWCRMFRWSSKPPEKKPSSLCWHVLLCPVPVCRTEEIHIINNDKEVEKIICYDLESHEISEVEMKGLPVEPEGFYVDSWVESLVPLT